MNWLDWTIIVSYLAGMIGLSVYLGRSQKDGKDYYLGGNDVSFWAIGLSTMATQCSTNSLLGAPGFIIGVGGLLWLQNELAVPLAMIGVMIFLLPFFRRQNVISVYEYLEKRFGVGTRTLMSAIFQFFRAFGTGVTVYITASFLESVVGINFTLAVVALGVITIIYDSFGGMKAVIYSDVIQMIILYSGIAVCLYYAMTMIGGGSIVSGWDVMWSQTDKTKAIDFSGHGFGDGKTYAFWPMLFGGFFLYMSYYGCDQTQVQRELSSKDLDDTNMSLFINGILRFPLVLTYCLLGLALAAFIIKTPEFANIIPFKEGTDVRKYDLAVPLFCLKYLPHGIIGLIMVALFSAAMSSLDSTINSLSATTIRDFVERFGTGELEPKQQLFWSRVTTVFWGVVCISFSFFVGNISNSVIESINKIGSMSNGPILGTFMLAILTRRANGSGTVTGIIAGIVFNTYLWLYQPEVSFLWWNLIGFVVTFGVGYITSISIFKNSHQKTSEELDELVYQKDASKFFEYKRNWPMFHGILVLYFLFIFGVLYWISSLK